MGGGVLLGRESGEYNWSDNEGRAEIEGFQKEHKDWPEILWRACVYHWALQEAMAQATIRQSRNRT